MHELLKVHFKENLYHLAIKLHQLADADGKYDTIADMNRTHSVGVIFSTTLISMLKSGEIIHKDTSINMKLVKDPSVGELIMKMK